MPVTATDIHGIGEALRTGTAVAKTREEVIRTAYGRAYYAAFHAVRSAYRDAQRDQSLWIKHRELIDYLFFCGRPELGTWSDRLKALRVDREDADYELAKSIDSGRLEHALNEALDFISQGRWFVTQLSGLPRHDKAPFMPKAKSSP